VANKIDVGLLEGDVRGDTKTAHDDAAALAAKATSCTDRATSLTDFRYKRAPPVRILIGKVGLDGHDRGAKYVAHILRDAGYEVIYTGIRRSPEQIAATAIQEDVTIVGLSFLSGAHKGLFKRVIHLLKDSEAGDIMVVGGGTIPATDISALREMGVEAVFTPGASAKSILETLETLLKQHGGASERGRPATRLASNRE